MNFFQLTPERVLEAVEASGLLCTGRCIAMNSFENRVYDVELEGNDGSSLSSSRRIAKFYRPERWTPEQILEEHQFLADLQEAEIPAIAPIPFPNGKTLHCIADSKIWYVLFPKVGGRAIDELSDEQLVRVGRLLGRMHNVGAARKSSHRISLDTRTYGYSNLEFLLKNSWIPPEFVGRYESTVRQICEISAPLLEAIPYQRIHGDCHFGNLLWNQNGPFFLDFDDMVFGPEVQDIWLLVPGRDDEATRRRNVLIEGYQEIRDWNPASIRLIESLRALRIVHYTAWIAKRWNDPAFPLAFPQFNTHTYWQTELAALEDQLRFIRQEGEESSCTIL